MRRLLFGMFVANLLLVVIIEIGGSLYIATGYGVMFSKYREIDLAGAIDHSILESRFEMDIKNDWGVVVEHLADGFVVGLLRSRHVIALMFGANGLCALILWREAGLPAKQQSNAV